MRIAFIVDGASSGNGLAAAFGIVVKNIETGSTINAHGEYIGPATNNDAEYQAVIHALEIANEMLEDHEISEIVVLSDSNLVVSQINGEFKVKTPNLRVYVDQVEKILKKIKVHVKNVRVEQVPREYTHEADQLARTAADQGRESEIEKKYPFLKK